MRKLLPLLVALILPLVSCKDTSGLDTVMTTVQLRGSVNSSENNTGISGARVRLGIGGHFSFPATIDSTTTDASGAFQLLTEIRHSPGQCGYWIGASAPGYESSDPAFSVASIRCVSAEQSVVVRLRRVGT
jgi:hypothetical protein